MTIEPESVPWLAVEVRTNVPVPTTVASMMAVEPAV